MSLERSHSAIESRHECAILKSWFMPLGVKLGATNSLG